MVIAYLSPVPAVRVEVKLKIKVLNHDFQGTHLEDEDKIMFLISPHVDDFIN